MSPGRTTATQPSGLPLPLPMRTSAGFLVKGLSGKMRIQTWPPRFTWRVMAIRAASICWAVSRPHSSACRPKSPKAMKFPRLALPLMRPFICLRYFTRFGLSISLSQSCHSEPPKAVKNIDPSPAAQGDNLDYLKAHALFGAQDLAVKDPGLHPDDPVGGHGLGEAVVAEGPEGVERHPSFPVPFLPGDFGPGQAAFAADLDALGPELQGLAHRLFHGPAERDPAFQLLGDIFRHQLGVDFGFPHLLHVDDQFPAHTLFT